jgi:hypothetical protein
MLKIAGGPSSAVSGRGEPVTARMKFAPVMPFAAELVGTPDVDDLDRQVAGRAEHLVRHRRPAKFAAAWLGLVYALVGRIWTHA